MWQDATVEWAARLWSGGSPEERADAVLARVVFAEIQENVEPLIDLVVNVAEQCWRVRMTEVLHRLARVRQGDIVEVDGFTLGPVHGYAWLPRSHYHATCYSTFAALRRIAQSIQQRGSVLPPSFPPLPRHHGHHRGAVDEILVDVLERMRKNTEGLFRCFRTRLPAVTPELSFEYGLTSEVRVVPTTPHVRAVPVMVPFFLTEMPRYMAEVVHEIAHVYLTNEEIQAVVLR